MKRNLLTLLFLLATTVGWAQGFSIPHRKGRFYSNTTTYYLLDNNPRYGRDAKTAWGLAVGYVINKRVGVELSGASFGYEWKYNPRYLSLDLQHYSLTKQRVRVVTSIGYSLVQGYTDENKEYLRPAVNIGASLQYLCTRNSYVGLNFRRMEWRNSFNAFMLGVSFGGYF